MRKKRVKVADLVQDSQRAKQSVGVLLAADNRQKMSVPSATKGKGKDQVITSISRATAKTYERPMESMMKPQQTSVIEDVMSQKVLQLSLNQFTSISPSARTELKTELTKKHRKKRTKEKQNSLAVIDTPSHGVPRASVIVNNMRVEAVLDGGSTVCIVSLKLVKLLATTELESTNRSQGICLRCCQKPEKHYCKQKRHYRRRMCVRRTWV